MQRSININKLVILVVGYMGWKCLYVLKTGGYTQNCPIIRNVNRNKRTEERFQESDQSW